MNTETQMSPEEMRIAIAVAVGWNIVHQLPDYLNSLDAMHEAEKTLVGQQCELYHQMLDSVMASDTQERNGENECDADDYWFHATAAQKACAFIRVKALGPATREEGV